MRSTQNASGSREQAPDQPVTDARVGHGGSLLRAARARHPAALLALQRQAGNGAVASMLGSSRALCRCPGRCTCGGALEGEQLDDDRPRVLAREPAASGADLRCSYEARQIAKWGGPAGPMPTDKVSKNIVTAFTGCDIAYVTIDVTPKASADDPSGEAIDRAESIKKALIQWIGPKRFSEDRFYTGLSSGSTDGAEVEVWLAGENRGQHGSSSGQAPMGPPAPPPAPDAPRSKESEHLGVQGGVGDVRHYYTTPYGPNDALHEWVNQVVAAYTMQRHANNQSGEERQIFAQVQYSLTTKQFTVSFGGQESYVIALPANLQLSFWAQLTAGQNVSGGTSQESISAGTQLVWQPVDWLSFGVQGGVGPTVQSKGPSSIDRAGLLFFQIQK